MYLCVRVFLSAVHLCVWWDSSLWAVFVYLLAESGESVYAFIREMPRGIADSINPIWRREFLIPHHTPSNSQSYQLAGTIWMAQFNTDASICSHMQMRFKWSHYFHVRLFQIKRALLQMRRELHQRYQENWYSGGSKSASFLLFKSLLARKNPRFSKRTTLLSDSFWSFFCFVFMTLLLIKRPV